jgi:hypothetical protein
MSTKPLSKAAQARVQQEADAKDKLAVEFQLFKETYTQKLFELACEWRENVDASTFYPAAQYSKDGFTFEYPMHAHTDDVRLPHTVKLEHFNTAKYDFLELEMYLEGVAEKLRLEQERLDKVSAAKDKARSLMTPEELKLLGL